MTPVADPVVVEEVMARLGDLARRDEPIGPLTTYRVGGAAAVWCEVVDEADLALVSEAVRATGIAVLVTGKGSNLLVADRGFPGLVLQLGDAFRSIEIDGVNVRAGGAVYLPVLARRTAAAGLTGLEWAVGVPGSVGGSVRMNAGGHGSNMAASLARVHMFDVTTGEDGAVPAGDLDLAYRHSAVTSTMVVTAAEFALAAGDRKAAEATIADIVKWRRANQPGGQNAGSVFTNPPDDSAGRLIDAAGCKGLRIGTAMVSPKHANFIQADPGGRADDVWRLLIEVRSRVLEHTGIVLRPENRLIGFDELPEA